MNQSANPYKQGAKYMTTQDIYDITIIGGGPSGLYAAFYTGLRAAKTKIIDSLPQLGGQLAALYPDKYIYDIPGFPRVLAKEFVERQIEQAKAFSPGICLNEKVIDLGARADGMLELKTEPGNVHLSRSVIVAAGVGAFVPRSLDIPDVKRIASEVYLVHRRDKFRAHEESIHDLFASPSKVLLYHELKALHGEDHIEAATVFDNRTGEETTLPVDALVSGLGYLANLGPIKNWGLEISGNSIRVDTTMRTNLPGVYAVGDITTYEGKIKLIATATAEAAIAANYAKGYLDPKSRIFPGHSSERDTK
jgi:thioredoxin reductase